MLLNGQVYKKVKRDQWNCSLFKAVPKYDNKVVVEFSFIFRRGSLSVFWPHRSYGPSLIELRFLFKPVADPFGQLPYGIGGDVRNLSVEIVAWDIKQPIV